MPTYKTRSPCFCSTSYSRAGKRFVSIVDNADTDNKANKKSRQINGLVNEWYLEDISDNIRSILTNRRNLIQCYAIWST